MSISKKVLKGEAAKIAILNGLNDAADVTKITYGPMGRQVAIDQGFGTPKITNDGISVLRDILFKDRFANMGVDILRDTATKTNDESGDGTTATTILTQYIANEGFKYSTKGINVMALKAGIQQASEDVIAVLRTYAKPIDTDEEIARVATTSAESEENGKIIAETVKQIGKDGIITVEESNIAGVRSEVVNGMQFDKGFVSPYMITDQDKAEAEYRDVPILVTDKKISNVKEMMPILEKLLSTGQKELVIIAEDIEGDALATFIMNKLRGSFSILAIKAPGFGDRKKEILEDIAILVGATVISDSLGIKIENISLNALGKAKRILSNKDRTVVVEGNGLKSDVDKRIEQIKAQKELYQSKHDKDKCSERIAKLSGGIAVIRVGAATDSEMRYLKDKIEDAVNATKAAIADGIVPGGASSLVHAASVVSNDIKRIKFVKKETKLGYKIVLEAMEEPMRQLAINAGRSEGSSIFKRDTITPMIEKIKRSSILSGYDALNDKVVNDMIECGIIDSFRVTLSGVKNSVSAASILITTEAAIAIETPEKSSN